MCVKNINCYKNWDAKLGSRSVGVKKEHPNIDQDLESTDLKKLIFVRL